MTSNKAPKFDRAAIMKTAHERAKSMQEARANLPHVFAPITYREAFAIALKNAWKAAKDAIITARVAAEYAALTQDQQDAQNQRLASLVNRETRANLYPAIAA